MEIGFFSLRLPGTFVTKGVYVVIRQVIGVQLEDAPNFAFHVQLLGGSGGLSKNNPYTPYSNTVIAIMNPFIKSP